MGTTDEFFAACISAARSQNSNGTTTSKRPDPRSTERVLPQPVVASNPYPGAITDFYGLPSNPLCIYKTGDAWPVRQGPEAQRVIREARPICNHPIQKVWEDLGEVVYKLLDSRGLRWTSIDPVCFAEEGGKAGPLHLWIGVEPKSLSFENAKVAAKDCKEILAKAGFPDVEIAFRESIYARSAGPKLLNHVPTVDPTADIRSPFTPALGVQIAPEATPYYEGTGAIYFRESSQSERVLLLTCRHVAIPPPVDDNKLYNRKNKNNGDPAREVVILGEKAYKEAIDPVMVKIGKELERVDGYNRELNALGKTTKGEDVSITRARQEVQEKIADAEKKIADVHSFYDEIAKFWSTPSQRVLGSVLYAPPISIGTEKDKHTQDWALIDINLDKIDWKEFKGNVVYLGAFFVLLWWSSLTILFRQQDRTRKIRQKNAPPCLEPVLLQVSPRRPPAS